MSSSPKASPQAKAATDRFLAFYAELAEAKQMAGRMTPPAPPPATETNPEQPSTEPAEEAPQQQPTPPAPSESLAGTSTPPSGAEANPAPEAAEPKAAKPIRVTDIFLKLHIAICPEGKPPPSLDGYPDIGYVMAAMADEAMLCQVKWPGRTQWLQMLLEDSLYGSRIAGERLFEIGNGIVAGDIVGRDDLAAAILLALSLDFRGRWRGISDDGKINALRRKLYEVVYGQPTPDQLNWQAMEDSALKPVLDQGKLIRLPRLLPWIGAIATVCLIYLVLSTVVWTAGTGEVLQRAEAIQQYNAAPAGEDKS